MEFTKEQKMYAEIVQRAWEDAEFKKELIANPVAAIEKMTGETLNLQGKTLVVKDQTDESVVHINIPAKAQADAELNEEQLEAVSGGAGVFPIKDILNPFPGGCFPTGPVILTTI